MTTVHFDIHTEHPSPPTESNLSRTNIMRPSHLDSVYTTTYQLWKLPLVNDVCLPCVLAQHQLRAHATALADEREIDLGQLHST